MKAMLKRAISVFLVVAIVLCSAPLSGLIGLDLPDWADLSIKSSAATFDDINKSSVFFKQQEANTCTLASATMLVRRAAILNGNANWANITEANMRGTAWRDGTGLYYNFTYAGITVGHATLPGGSANASALISLLASHPEGVVIFDRAIPHAILLTDYTNGVFYCADPGHGTASGRMPISGACVSGIYQVTIANVDDYWYVSSPKCSFTHSHSYTATITQQPTCTATGVKTFKCSCGESYTQTIKATGHSYNTTSVLPTETEQGYTLYECKNCSYSYTDDYIDPPVYQDGWYYCDALPSNINSDDYIIEYKHYYEKQQKESPGDGWTNAGVAKTEWVNSGDVYVSYYDLTTSDSRVLTGTYYFHYCGPDMGQTVNYEHGNGLVHWDQIYANKIASEEFVENDKDGGMPVYFLKWADGSYVYCQSDVTCDGAYGSHGQRSKYWYKMNHYQDRVKVTTYKFTKETDYISELDESATDITYRYKLNHIHATEEQIIPATCTATGLKKVVCTTCNEIISSTIIPMIAHNYSTFVEFGTEHPHYAVYKCVCGARQTKTETSNDDKCEICNPSDTNGEFKFSIKEPSRTTIRCKDGIVLRADIKNVPSGAKIVWTTNNNNFDFEQSSDGKSLMIISSNNGYTTFTATLIDSNGDILSYDTVEMYSKAGFFDKLGGFFRSLFGATKIYEN